MATHLHIIYGCLRAGTAELGGTAKSMWPTELKILTTGLFIEKVSDPGSSPLKFFQRPENAGRTPSILPLGGGTRSALSGWGLTREPYHRERLHQ